MSNRYAILDNLPTKYPSRSRKEGIYICSGPPKAEILGMAQKDDQAIEGVGSFVR